MADAAHPFTRALIIGAGAGLSASLARLFLAKGLTVDLARRSPDPSDPVTAELAAAGVATHACEAGDPESVEALFEALDETGAPDVVVYNPSARARGPLVELDPMEVERALEVTAFGAFLAAQAAARRMVAKPAPAHGVRGAILFTGASASVKGFALSAPFAMGKFAQRGLAQSLARELHPQGVHIGHVVIDGAIRSEARGRVEAAGDGGADDRFLDPDAVARAYWDLIAQDRSAWAWEIELRPWVERF